MQLKNQNNQNLISQAMNLKRQLDSQGMNGEQYLKQLISSGKFSEQQVRNAMETASRILGKK